MYNWIDTNDWVDDRMKAIMEQVRPLYRELLADMIKAGCEPRDAIQWINNEIEAIMFSI